MRTRAPLLGLLAAFGVLALTFTLPHLLDWDVRTRAPRSAVDGVVPPLHGYWEPTWFGPGTLPALLLALLAWRYAVQLADRLPWRRLLLVSFVVGTAWLFSLALVDGESGISRVLGNPYEYLQTARAVDDVPALLDGFIDRIPKPAEDNWPTHVAGHPPGALLFFVLLARLGLGGDFAAGAVVTLIAATIPVAVLVLLRTLGAESVARRAAPFLVMAPAALFLAVSADAAFTALACWGMVAVALAARADREGRTAGLVGWGALSGLLLGYGVFCSYGFAILGLVAVAVLVAARSWRPLLVSVPAALVVVGVFAAYGFAWWEAYPVLVERYHDGIAADRPMTYWWWGNIGALLVSTGPLVGAGLGAVAVAAPGVLRRSSAAEHAEDGDVAGRRVAVLIAVAGVACVVLADVSGMSKSEVERIWLIFVPWLLVSCALLPERWRRHGLGLQVAAALIVQHLLYTSW
ncbi:hypothetical protein KUV85_06350 [Nocardioides panacisoli]|uniref:hypothetical protein n=1 Tax=Nocardioides panacisoli TaxID=627624 RepID=UPI001C63530A|nr:hypothetical protein [Nocardioides panacisoli]QYJ05294.1 hypothetical protein KUV85_06350 [Nocardioides panacisoli]